MAQLIAIWPYCVSTSEMAVIPQSRTM